MTNFDFLKAIPEFSSFADMAAAAEKLFANDTAACIFGCRRAMEGAVKWMYATDTALEMPYADTLVTLINTPSFREIVDGDLWQKLNLIRLMGNRAAHSMETFAKEKAMQCLKALHDFMDFLTYCYTADGAAPAFDEALVRNAEPELVAVPGPDRDIEALREENRELRERLSELRETKQPAYAPERVELSEFDTRKLYIDVMLRDAGWTEGVNWLNEMPVTGMPNASGKGYVDYALCGDDGRVLAIVEAKNTYKGAEQGRQQAKLYADCIERAQGRRPVIFLTNGYETRIDVGCYPERRVASIYSKRDLEKWFNLLKTRKPLADAAVDKAIAGRYYQENAIKAVCDSFDRFNRRKALLVMATGSGKTRTVIALCKALMESGWIRNVLFLADRNALVTQAKKAFANLLPELSITNLCEGKADYAAHGVFSTYQTMINCIDTVMDGEGRIFSCGHFDLVICDEAHRSIYNKYKAIFDYFDAPLVGLTATPKDEVGHNTYEIFELPDDVPTYSYELSQAVKDGYLVPYTSIETKLNFLENGIHYDELSDEEKEQYENTFADENGDMPDSIAASAINEFVFNEDTIIKVLDALMHDGLHTEYGNKLGKSIIFAKNHRHAEKILEVFNKEYPNLPGYAKVIDNYINYAQSAIDEFSEKDKLPQIAISVDMLDTGIDVPEVLNLVLFKKVMSKAKFWQMLGRGTRLCPGLLDGEDKTGFYVFDYLNNFEFFRMKQQEKEPTRVMSLAGCIVYWKAMVAGQLQKKRGHEDYVKGLTDYILMKIRQLNRDNFAVKMVRRCADTYSKEENLSNLDYDHCAEIADTLGTLIEQDTDECHALRFDVLIYKLLGKFLYGEKVNREKKDIYKKAAGLMTLSDTIPEIAAHKPLLDEILHNNLLESTEIGVYENIRVELRDLIKYLPKEERKFETTCFRDEMLSTEIRPAEPDDDDREDYRKKAEYYIRTHSDEPAIRKLKTNIPLTGDDVEALAQVLWSELGTKRDYEEKIGFKPLGEFVREIVGLDMNAAKEAFSGYLDETRLNADQIYFVNQIVEYIVKNGMMADLSVLQGAPFTDRGSVVDLFPDLTVWVGIRAAITQINDNAKMA